MGEQEQAEVLATAVSLGGGVQSTVLTLMADRGEFGPKPDLAIWADTGWEVPEVEEMVDWIADNVSFPVFKVSSEVGLLAALRDGKDSRGNIAPRSVPMHIEGGGMTRRWCTSQHKIDPIQAKLKNFVGIPKGGRMPRGSVVEVWLGITVDEIERVKPSNTWWERKHWPLVDVGMRRIDCFAWWEANREPGWPSLARSACVACPYKSDAELLDTYRSHPEMMAEASEAEARNNEREAARGFPSVYFHRARKPLLDVVQAISDADEAQMSLWGSECDGVCGT